MKKSKHAKPDLPPACSRCHGRPFVTTPAGQSRCTCERGRWFRAKDAERRSAA